MGFDPATVRNVIFDFGGVLFEIDYDLPVKAFAELGYGSFADVYTQAAQNVMFDQLETGRIDNESFMQYLHGMVPGASRTEVDQAWNSILLHILPEQVHFVRQVKDSGRRTFMLSNTNAIHVAEFEKMIAEKMSFSTFRDAFEKIYYSNVIGIKKPYPETYLKVCEWNGLIPSETLFIDDSIQHVLGAEKAGLQTYHLRKGELLNQSLISLLEP
jgi:HAD superfamily hydrolase (TIGR01509 family)